MTSASLSKIIKTQLWAELTIRNRFSIIPQVLASLVSFGICYEMHAKNPWTLISYFMIVFGCLSRIFLLSKIPKNTVPNLKLSNSFYFAVFLVGLGWANLFTDVSAYYGAFSSHSFYCLIIMAGQYSSGIATFTASPFGYLCLVSPMAFAPIFSGTLTTSFLVGFFTLFYLYHYKLSHNYFYKSIENALNLTLERDKLQTLLNAVPGSVSFIDKELRYQALNEFGKSYYKEEDVLGKSVSHLHPESQYAHFVSNFMEGPTSTATSELNIDLGGMNNTFIVSIKKIYEPFGGAVIVSVPMNELVKVREDLRVQEAKSQYTSKLVSLGEMAAGIAHEINNPLAIILGSSDQMEKILLRSDNEMTKLIEYNSKIQKTVERISKIIRSLKGLARNGENDPHLPFDFHTILEPCIEMCRQRFRDEKVKLEISHYNPNLTMVGQEIQLSQVLMNLINNAFDAAIENAQPRWVKIDIEENEDYLDIRVSDSGKGIPKHIKNRIMEPFFTTKPINKGTGLGLSISKTILESHQGNLLLDETAPHTTFVMHLKK
jgi:signal transduction histidine kinase